MADKSTPLILDALTRAFAEPAGLPLHGPKRGKGLFAASASAKEAAQRCLEEGYLRVLHREVHGKSSREFCALTEKGLAFVSTHVSPKQVLEELTRTLQGRQAQVAELVETARQWQAGLEALRTTIETVLQQMPHRAAAFAGVAGPAPSSNGSAHVPAELISCLNQWHSSGAPADCPLPELYRRVLPIAPSLTIGRFHDGLRQLHEGGQVYLHPWSGPLYEIPEPAFALLVGHEVAYYASVRDHSPLTTHHSPC